MHRNAGEVVPTGLGIRRYNQDCEKDTVITYWVQMRNSARRGCYDRRTATEKKEKWKVRKTEEESAAAYGDSLSDGSDRVHVRLF